MQTNQISGAAVVLSLAAALLSYVEINASRPYKALKRDMVQSGEPLPKPMMEYMIRYERILKAVSLGAILLGVGLMIFRAAG
ncbi:MAG TPA: hypothetical protein VIU33_02640, partial [Nitrospiria bacterium]